MSWALSMSKFLSNEGLQPRTQGRSCSDHFGFRDGVWFAPPSKVDDEPVLPPTPVELEIGKNVYNKNCAVCHDSSRDGSPRLGFLCAWHKRIDQGEPTLVQNAIDGIGLMPPRGENPGLTDEAIIEAVRYMMYRARLDIPARH